MYTSLQNKRVVVSGGTGGIGTSIVKHFLHEGAHVVYTGIEKAHNHDEYVQLAQEHNVAITYIYCDVSTVENVQQVVAEIAAGGSIDVLVNNAGITRDKLIMRMNDEDWHAVMDVNLHGVFYFSRDVAKIMLQQRSGAIVNIASIVGVVGNAGQCNYSASKAGVIGFTKSLAREVAGRSIRVNAIAPGFIQTPMTDKLSEKVKQMTLNNIPLQRYGTADEVAKLVTFLASDASSYITGEVISLTGGMGM